ncbi:MAG: DedA family protein [Patescibacteria group bacterium]
MFQTILELLASFVINTIETTGYVGIAVLMALESANIPIPSEIIMPFAGYLVFEEKFNFFLVVFWGAMGNLLGSLVSYYFGFFGGRVFLERFGKFIFITKHDLDVADSWFKKYGTLVIFASRVLPVVRTFISFPAGIAKMNVWKFTIYTFAGSLIWSIILTYAGVIAGANWRILEDYFHKFDWLVAFFLIVGVIWWVRRHIRLLGEETNGKQTKL